jgi:hypothetical protein
MKKPLLASLALLLSCTNQNPAATAYKIAEEKIQTAQCIAENTTIYDAWYCENCKELKADLEEEFPAPAWNVLKTNYIACYEGVDENPLCRDIYIFPTVKFQNGTVLEGNYIKGYLTLERLAKLSGCD